LQWQQLYLLVEEANIPEVLRKLQRNFVYGEANSSFVMNFWKHPEIPEELKDRLKLVIWGFYLNEIGLALKQYLRIRRELNLDEIERLSEKELLKMVLEKIERLSQKVEDENSKTREHIEINREEVIRKMAEREQRMQKFLEEMAEELTAVVQKLSSSNTGRTTATSNGNNGEVKEMLQQILHKLHWMQKDLETSKDLLRDIRQFTSAIEIELNPRY
jgi:hypothetical protein